MKQRIVSVLLVICMLPAIIMPALADIDYNAAYDSALLQAGNDLLLVSDHLEEAYESVLAAVEDGRISEDRINESVRRILRCKQALEAEERSREWQ